MRRIRAVLTVSAVLLVAGCSAAPAIEAATAERMQQAVLGVTTVASDGDLPGALAALDAVDTELEAAKVRGEVTEDRYLRIRAAIDALRAHLEQATAPPPPPVEEAPSGGTGGTGGGGSGGDDDAPEVDDDGEPQHDGGDGEGGGEQEPGHGGEGGGDQGGGSSPTPTPTPTGAKPTPTPAATVAAP